MDKVEPTSVAPAGRPDTLATESTSPSTSVAPESRSMDWTAPSSSASSVSAAPTSGASFTPVIVTFSVCG